MAAGRLQLHAQHTVFRLAFYHTKSADLAVMSMHYSERISVDEILHAFIQAHPRRLFQATLFVD